MVLKALLKSRSTAPTALASHSPGLSKFISLAKHDLLEGNPESQWSSAGP